MSNLEEALVTTLWDQSDDIANLILHHNPLIKLLDEAGRVYRRDLGYEIRKPVMWNDTAIGGFYAGYSNFNLDASDDLTAFRFAIKQAYEPVAISGREMRANGGDENKLIDVADMKKDAAISRLKNTVSTSLRGDGTGFSGLEFDGLKKAVSSSPGSGTYAQIDRATNAFAQNVAITVAGGLTAANSQDQLTDAISQTVRGDEMIDFAIGGRTAWKNLHSSLTAIQRIQAPTKTGKAGFRRLNYDGVDFYFDGGYKSSVLEANSWRMLNSEYVSFDMQKGADFKPLSKSMDRPVDQDAVFTVIIVEGNLCTYAPPFNVYIA